MFTGIIEGVGEVLGVEPGEKSCRLRIRTGELAEGVRLGDSVAVSGTCLSVCEIDGGDLGFDAIPETLERTALSDLKAGSRVNLERAMRADGRLDGHIVQGHVDGVGLVRDFVRSAEDVRLYVDCTPEFSDWLVDKGSVAVDGVSLTVVEADERGFHVALIPHTLRETTLGELQPGVRVNLEADVLGKYVKRYLSRIGAGGAE